MWESGSMHNNQVLAVRRQAPLTGYIVIGFYASDRDVFTVFRKHRLKTAIVFHISHYTDDSQLPKEYANVD